MAAEARVTVQTPSPQPSPTRGEGVREPVACASEALLVRKGSERIQAGQVPLIEVRHDAEARYPFLIEVDHGC